MARSRQPFSVAYQGRPCRASCSFSRTVGLEPDRGYVLTMRRLAGEFAVRRFDDGREFVDAGASVDPTVKLQGAAGPFLPAGPLELRSSVGAAAARDRQRVLVSHAYVLPDALDVASRDHGRARNDEVRIQVMDVRGVWPRRGAIYVAVNVLRQGGAQGAPAGGGGTQQRAAPGVGGAGGTIPADRFEPMSLRGGEPWTLRQVLEELILPALPGAPRLARIPQGYENRRPLGHVWEGTPAVDALEDVLDEFKLLVSLTLSGRVALWREGEGALRLDDGSDLAGSGAGVHRDEESFRFRYGPTVVEIVGAPTVETVKVDDWEPVGQDRSGRWVPLLDAASAWGIATIERLGALAALPFAEWPRSPLTGGLGGDAIDALQSWNFRAFRLPGSGGERAHMIPIVDRAELDDAGLHLRPVFTSTRVVTSSLADEYGAQADTLAAAAAEAARQAVQPIVSHTTSRGPIEGWRMVAPDVVQFDEPLGRLASNNVFAELATYLLPKVDGEFGFERKPAGRNPAKRENRYVSRWRGRAGPAGGGGTVIPVRDAGDTPALIVDRPDLRELVTASAGSNRATLDGIALQIASDELSRPDVEAGRILTLAGWWPVEVNGKVRSVTWTVTSGVGGALFPVTICSFGTSIPSGLGAPVAQAPPGRAHAIAARSAYYSVDGA